MARRSTAVNRRRPTVAELVYKALFTGKPLAWPAVTWPNQRKNIIKAIDEVLRLNGVV